MKIYFAGTESKPFLDVVTKAGSNKALMTYWAFKTGTSRFYNLIAEKPLDIFMDCGAYSAWSQGFTINVEDYGEFILQVKDRLTVYPNLDVKGDLSATLRNQEVLESMGLHPIPVFHVNTYNWDVLQEYVNNYDYIALGAIAGESTSRDEMRKVLDKVFSIAKIGETKFHGFGLTIKDILERYPFYSADSTSWMSSVRFGTNFSGTLMEQMHINKKEHKKMLSYGVKEYMKLEKYITDLWESRGIVWK